jgi:hypothetical protein
MKKGLWLVTIMISQAVSMDFRIGKGTYDADMSVKSFMQHNTTNDITVFYLSQEHTNFSKSPLFYYVDAEVYTSETKRQRTEFAGFIPSYEFPLVGSINDMTNDFIDMFPVDGDYEALGFDMNFGVGYDVIREGKSYVGIALNLGASLPTINAENLSTKISLAYDLIEKWDLDVTTYKIGPMFKANVVLYSNLSLYSSLSIGFQKGAVESELFKSSVDVNGDFRHFDIGLKYHPSQQWSLPKNLYVTFGHTYKHWSVDSVEVNLYNFFQKDVFSPFTTEFTSSYTYIGVGYHF